MKPFLQYAIKIQLSIVLLVCSSYSLADLTAALQEMENPENPLLLINTSRGEIYVELFPLEAPQNVQNIIALAQGEVELEDNASGDLFSARYYNGMRFHRVIVGTLIQAGSPARYSRNVSLQRLDDEINAELLGLNQQMVLLPDGNINPLLNIADKSEFDREILEPLYRQLRIESESELAENQSRVLTALQRMTVQQAYENQGYRYNSNLSGRGISRGVMALANSGPDDNGPEFFISLQDADWLSGKHTVVGKVVDGLEAVIAIGETAIDPGQYSSLSTLIYSVRVANN